MKRINNSVLRSAFAMILGFVLVLWPEAAVTYLVITIGICFIIPGIFSTELFHPGKGRRGTLPHVSDRRSRKHFVWGMACYHAGIFC